MRGRAWTFRLLILVAIIAAQDPATMSISGRIVSAATGKPVPGAMATARCDTCDYVVDAKAGADGRFQIAVREASRYQLFASAPGYLAETFGNEPEIGGTPLLVAAGAQIRNIDLRLHHGSTIAGVVTDNFKEPVVGATVTAVARRSVNGGFVPVPESTTRTDDRGTYRLIGLAPGEYVVAASEGLNVTLAASAATTRRITVGVDTNQEGVNIQTEADAHRRHRRHRRGSRRGFAVTVRSTCCPIRIRRRCRPWRSRRNLAAASRSPTCLPANIYCSCAPR